MSRKQSQGRRNIREFAPMQEIADSIYEMLERIKRLDYRNQTDLETYRAICRRIMSQTHCLLGVTEDNQIRNSEEYEKMRKFFTSLANQKSNPLLAECTSAILKCLQRDQE